MTLPVASSKKRALALDVNSHDRVALLLTPTKKGRITRKQQARMCDDFSKQRDGEIRIILIF